MEIQSPKTSAKYQVIQILAIEMLTSSVFWGLIILMIDHNIINYPNYPTNSTSEVETSCIGFHGLALVVHGEP